LRRANGAQELGRFQDRLSFLYVESCRVDRDNNAVTVIDEKGAIHVPTAILAALLPVRLRLGPPSSMVLLA
jgi:CRISPR-associated protein Cas1